MWSFWTFYYRHRPWVLLSALAAVGCLALMVGLMRSRAADDGMPGMVFVAVSGTITYQGKPAPGARVVFHPMDPGHPAAYGKTDASGCFTLTSIRGRRGAAVGAYRVTVMKQQLAKDHDTRTTEEILIQTGGKPPPPPSVIDILPTCYGNPKTSGLAATVTSDGDNKFEFTLK